MSNEVVFRLIDVGGVIFASDPAAFDCCCRRFPDKFSVLSEGRLATEVGTVESWFRARFIRTMVSGKKLKNYTTYTTIRQLNVNFGLDFIFVFFFYKFKWE